MLVVAICDLVALGLKSMDDVSSTLEQHGEDVILQAATVVLHPGMVAWVPPGFVVVPVAMETTWLCVLPWMVPCIHASINKSVLNLMCEGTQAHLDKSGGSWKRLVEPFGVFVQSVGQ